MSGEQSPPRMRTRSSVRRSFRTRPDQIVVDDEIILTPARPSRRSRRTASVAPPTPPRAVRRRSKARRQTQEGESEPEEETQEEQVEGESEPELEQVVELSAEEKEDLEEEEEEEEDKQAEEELLESTEDEDEENEDEDEEEEDSEVVLRPHTRPSLSPVVAVPVAVPAVVVPTKQKQGEDHTAVVLLLAFCTLALLCTSGLVLFRLGSAPPSVSLPEAHWTEDAVAFLTDQRILSSVRTEVEAMEKQLRQHLQTAVVAQGDQQGRLLATQVEEMLASISSIREEVRAYEAASTKAQEAPKAGNAADGPSAAAVTQLQATQDQMRKQIKQLTASLETAREGTPAGQDPALLSLAKSVAVLDERISALHAVSSDVTSLREEALRKIGERMAAHDDLVARYTRDMDSLLAMLDETKQTAATTAMATSTLMHSMEDLSIPQMAEIEGRVRTIVDAELAKQPALAKPGLGKDHVAELISAALAKEAAGRPAPLTRAEVEAEIAASVQEVAGEVADLKHRMAAAPSKATLDTPAAITAEMSAEMVEAERSRIMTWVTHAIEKARLPPAPAHATPAPAVRTPAAPLQAPVGGGDVERIRAAVMEDVYRLLFADAVGKADYALASGGARVIDYSGKWSVKRMLGWLSPFPSPSAEVEEVLAKDTALGSCWPMAGNSGFITVQLAKRVLVDSFSLDHIASAVAHNQQSAPRDFRVWGYTARGSKAIFMGDFSYDINGQQVQTFAVTEGNDTAVSIVKLEILSNHGLEDYTCIYRFRVHGSPIELAL